VRRPKIDTMKEIIRIVDGDEDSLERRVVSLLAQHQGYAVSRFTHWFTARPPLYEAVLTAPDRAG
jgi:hypothetical protein